jgi:hypothetical protein
MQAQSDAALLHHASDRTQALLATLHHDLLELQRSASTADPLKANAAAQAEAGLALYRAAVDAALRVAENLAPTAGG